MPEVAAAVPDDPPPAPRSGSPRPDSQLFASDWSLRPTQPAPKQVSQSVAQGYIAPTFEEARKLHAPTEPLAMVTDTPRAERAEVLAPPTARDPAAPSQQAHGIAQQMASAARQVAPGTIDLRLYPEELGRIRLQFDISEQALVISVTAERSETADLMRRHLDQLAREMQNLGYRDVSFRFSGDGAASQFGAQMGDGSSSGDAPKPGTGHAPSPEEHLATSTETSPLRVGAEGLDLRI